MRPTLLDLFCGEGGASEGYHRAGFDVTGVGNNPRCRLRYPHRFVLGDALDYLSSNGKEYDLIHASPPCQAYSFTRFFHPKIERQDLVGETRRLLRLSGVLYIIENVVGAPLLCPLTLCGTMFSLRVYRHRLFESSLWPTTLSILRLDLPPHPRHIHKVAPTEGGYSKGHRFVSIYGKNYNFRQGREATGIGWMSREGLSQSIPPAYTEFLGLRVLPIL